MRTILFVFILSLVISVQAQDGFVFSGRITGDDGTPVEYASIGVPGKNIGTFTATDGTFSLLLPAGVSDTLHISHVSYEAVKIPAALLQQRDTVIAMQAKGLSEVVIYNGKKKRAELAGNGMRIPGAATMWSVGSIGCEIGSVIETKRVFEVQEIRFKIRSNRVAGAKMSVNIYKADESTGNFLNTLYTPVYVDIPLSDKKQEVGIEVTRPIVIEPGRYFVSIMFIDYDRDSISDTEESGRIYFPLYMKQSYIRNGVMEELDPIPVNMGLVIKGYEYL